MDVLVALLLVVTIGYAVRLNKRLGMLRRDKAKLEKLAVTFSESTIRADESLGHLSSTADMMQKQIEAAQALHDDLAFLLDRGEKAADRLEDVVRQSREFNQHPRAGDNSDSGHMKAVKPEGRDSGVPDRSVSETDHVMERTTSVSPAPMMAGSDEITAQSDAELELLKALRSAN